MTRFVKIAYLYNHDPWTRSEVWVRGVTTMNTLGHHCGIESGCFRLYLKVNERWTKQTQNDVVVPGGDYLFVFAGDVVLDKQKKKELEIIEKEKKEMKKRQVEKRMMNKCLLPERV